MAFTTTMLSWGATGEGVRWDLAGETAAALAAASIVFRRFDANYARLLLKTARNVMEFSLKYRGSYSESLGSPVCPFYCSYSGYTDELLWGAAWLFMRAGGLYIGGKSNENVIHCRIWCKLSTTNSPQRSSLPSVRVRPQPFGCEAGFQPFYYTPNPNPNILTGAVVGGENQNDFYSDDRTDYSHS